MEFEEIDYSAKKAESSEKKEEFREFTAKEFAKKHGEMQSNVFHPEFKARIARGPIWNVYKRGEGFFPIDRTIKRRLFPETENNLSSPEYKVLMFLILEASPMSGIIELSTKQISCRINTPLTKLYSSLKKLQKAKLIAKFKRRDGSMVMMLNPSFLKHRSSAVQAKLHSKFDSLFN